ncbi:MAG: methyltransferase domain-containing protein [Anaerolineaceae bacterium]|nr:methyltransferase domain-containing protein [Anaerolineaceae bacterium]
MNSPQAFDPLAPAYDDTFTDTIIGRYLREQVQTRLARHFRAGDMVLELGCGTGEDAFWLAGRGVRVLATDVSEGMLAAARAKTAENPLVEVARLDLTTLPEIISGVGEGLRPSRYMDKQIFNGGFSNFGPLNCLGEWRTLAAWLAGRIQPGGIVGLGVMSPLCLWEPLWHSLHGDFKTATRRWRQTTFQPDAAAPPIAIHYPTIRRLTRDFAPHFQRVYVQPLGLFLPPSDVFPVIQSRPHLLNRLLVLEKRFGKYSKLALFADHYWIEFKKR